uniref:Protein kinase domain-containing protein n=1 Tax=Pavo cristatus TaxID=9049 RepID=A0A8C9G903_PAVCR
LSGSFEKLLCNWGFMLGLTLGEDCYSEVKAAISTKKKVPLSVKVNFLPWDVSILFEIHHPKIMHISCIVGLSFGNVYIVMEVAATDLLQQVQNLGKLPCIPEGWDIFTHVVGVMHCLHDCNLLHQDLKPEHHFLHLISLCSAKGSAAQPLQCQRSMAWRLGVVLFLEVTGLCIFFSPLFTGLCLANISKCIQLFPIT